MVYDIASKRLVEIDPKAFLSLVLGRKVSDCQEIQELPQEMPKLNRADQVWWTQFAGDARSITLLEFITSWDRKKKLDVVLYTYWLKRAHDCVVTPVVVLCLANNTADDVYEDENSRFKFKLVRLWELDAQAIFTRQQLSLYPLLPLMRGGLELTEPAGKALAESALESDVKADLLAIFGIFLGLTDEERAANFIWKRSNLMNIMVESPFYHWIKDQGREEGWHRGREEGRQTGIQEGRLQGLIEAVQLGLELKFPSQAPGLKPLVENCQTISTLETALEALRRGTPFEKIAGLFRNPPSNESAAAS